MSGSSCLLPEPGITLLPSLAGKIGVNEALFLQQIHYWITRQAGAIDQYGRYWIYNTIKQWQEQLSFLSESTIKRAIVNLESDGVLLSTWIGTGFSRKKAYTIDYDRVDRISQEIIHDLAQKSMKGRGQKNPTIVVSVPPPKKFDAREEDQIDEELPVKFDDAAEQVNLTHRERQNGAIEQFNLTRRTVQIDLSERVNLTSREESKETAEMPTSAWVHGASLARACVTKTTAQNTQRTTSAENHVEEEIRDGTSTEEVCPDEVCPTTSGTSSDPVVVLSDDEELLCFCDALGVPRASAKKFIRMYGADRVQEKLKLLKESQKRQRIINAGGWLYKALQQDYHLSPLQKKNIAQAENLRMLAEKTRTQIDLESQTEIQESAGVSPEILRKFPMTIQERYRKSRESGEGRASPHPTG